jgi:hypothetical protein
MTNPTNPDTRDGMLRALAEIQEAHIRILLACLAPAGQGAPQGAPRGAL